MESAKLLNQTPALPATLVWQYLAKKRLLKPIMMLLAKPISLVARQLVKVA